MSKIRALLVSALLATTLVGGAMTATHSDAKAPVKNRGGGDSWCC